MMAVTLRRLGEEDWETLRAVRLSALRDAPAAFWTTYTEALDRPEAEWRELARAAEYFVAELGGTVVGVAAGHPGEPEWELISMWVAPKARHRGVGRALVEAVIESARKAGAAAIFLEVADENPEAQRLYESCGFVRTGPGVSLPHSPHASQSRMRREL